MVEAPALDISLKKFCVSLPVMMQDAGLSLLVAVIKGTSLVMALIVVYLWANVVFVYSRLRKVVLRWERPQFGIIAVTLFVLMLLFLSGSLLSYAFYIRDVGQKADAHQWLYAFIGLSVLLFLTGLAYLALKALYMQPIGEEGLYKIGFNKRYFLWRPELLSWSEIYDYYVREGEFFSDFTFIMRDGSAFMISTPTYLVKTISKIADYSIDKYAFLMRYGRKVSKSSRQR